MNMAITGVAMAGVIMGQTDKNAMDCSMDVTVLL